MINCVSRNHIYTIFYKPNKRIFSWKLIPVIIEIIHDGEKFRKLKLYNIESVWNSNSFVFCRLCILRNVVSTGTHLPYENGNLTRKFSTSFLNTASFFALSNEKLSIEFYYSLLRTSIDSTERLPELSRVETRWIYTSLSRSRQETARAVAIRANIGGNNARSLSRFGEFFS